MKILVTGSAGFIGANVAKALVLRGDVVLGIDNFTAYYNPQMKRARIAPLIQRPNYSHLDLDISDTQAVESAVRKFTPEIVVHLGAQAGVRYAEVNPHSYGRSNLIGFLNMLESSKNDVKHLVYASSSSVYGLNESLPFTESDSVSRPTSLYAATKIANEAMAYAYSCNSALRTTGIRFFTVYGPWGRPDMMPIKFAHSILGGRPIELFNSGHHTRDFTYIDDAVDGVLKIVDSTSQPTKTSSNVFNIGGESPVHILKFVDLLEDRLGKRAIRISVPRQAGDMLATHADNRKLREATGWKPQVTLEDGVQRFAEWALDNIEYLKP